MKTATQEVQERSNHVCKPLLTEAGEVVAPELVPFIQAFCKDGDKFVVSNRELELANARKNGGKVLLGEIMIESGKFVIGDPCFTERLPYDKALDACLDNGGEAGEILVPSSVDKESGLRRVGGTVVVSRPSIGAEFFRSTPTTEMVS